MSLRALNQAHRTIETMSLPELLAIAVNDIAFNRDNLGQGVLKAIADNPMLFNAVSGLIQETAIFRRCLS